METTNNELKKVIEKLNKRNEQLQQPTAERLIKQLKEETKGKGFNFFNLSKNLTR